MEDIAAERILKLPVVRRRQSTQIRALTAVERFAEGPHPFRNREVTGTHFPQIGVKIAAKNIEQLLADPAHRTALTIEARQQEDDVKDDQVKPPLNRVGHPVIAVKRYAARLRHDRAIEVADAAIL
jgi:hypothetical protein